MQCTQFNVSVGGYPVDLFVKSPPFTLICGICLDVLKDPHQCLNGHLFCLSCISKSLEGVEQCPTCKHSLTVATLSRCLSQRNEVNDLMIKCELSTKPGDCFWQGPLHERDSHLAHCQMRLVDCQMKVLGLCVDCPTGKVLRRDEHAHYLSQHVSVNMVHNAAKAIQRHTYQVGMPGYAILRDGDCVYSGQIDANSIKHGRGILQHTDQSDAIYYSGMWKHGAKHGRGVQMTWLGELSGQWVDGAMQGPFTLTGEHVSIVGNMLNDSWSGDCTVRYTNIGVYVGELSECWDMYLRHGCGCSPLWWGRYQMGSGSMTCSCLGSIPT